MSQTINQCQKCGNASDFDFAPGSPARPEEFKLKCLKCGKKGPQRLTKETAIKAWNEGKKK